ncbi:hypothetical protein MRB53_015811 [Persea americana]|uniref:Uncharacterized protein n=1 Tax=Persea americana TaxID=3435 RepID=A0ACC2M057_PERAE|nr:hypothetical protein MRB53_015811 [Persea americana]
MMEGDVEGWRCFLFWLGEERSFKSLDCVLQRTPSVDWILINWFYSTTKTIIKSKSLDSDFVAKSKFVVLHFVA